MYWLRRPPYLRWITAGLVLIVGLFIEMRPVATETYPFVSAPLVVGHAVDSSVEWREVPAGLLPAWDGSITGVAVANVAVGTPLLPELVAAVSVPDGWWAVALNLPHYVAPDTPIRVSLNGAIVEGRVVGEVADNGFELVAPVAFPAEEAAHIAAEAATSALVVMIGSRRHALESDG